MASREQILETTKKWLQGHNDRNWTETGVKSLLAPGFIYRSFPASVKQPDKDSTAYLEFQGQTSSLFSTYKATDTDILVDEGQRKVVYFALAEGVVAGSELVYKNEYVHKLLLTEDGKLVQEFDAYVDSKGMLDFMGAVMASQGDAVER